MSKFSLFCAETGNTRSYSIKYAIHSNKFKLLDLYTEFLRVCLMNTKLVNFVFSIK